MPSSDRLSLTYRVAAAMGGALGIALALFGRGDAGPFEEHPVYALVSGVFGVLFVYVAISGHNLASRKDPE